MASNIDLFFNTSRNKRTFPEVLAEIQEYLASKYSTLITDNPEEQHQQITAYIAKYLNDYSLGVEGMSHEEAADFACAAGALNSLGLGAHSYIQSEEQVVEFMRTGKKNRIKRA